MTAIPYLDEVWSVTTGCGDDMVSPGCLNCYARRMFGRNLWECPECDGTGQIDVPGILYGQRDEMDCPRCDGTGHQDFTPTFHADRLDQPLHWRKPRRVGVSFMGDLFHEAITDEQIFRVWQTMTECSQHTFLVLTKRPQRMHDWWGRWWGVAEPNVWLGVTVCNQEEADRNVPILLDTPAAVRWVSLEPMLGAVDLLSVASDRDQYHYTNALEGYQIDGDMFGVPKLDWVVLGGETGPGARPMQPEWALDVYRQCKAAGVAFWFKSMGTAKIPPRWDWPGAPGTELLAEMQATHELPAVLAEAVTP